MTVMIARLGATAAQNVVYVCNSQVFPTLFCTTAMGICNVIAQTVTISSPIVAGLEGNTPVVVFTIISALGALISVGL